MAGAVSGRGAGGQGSIVFRQNLDYPREPGQITYYPPEPTEELKRQVRKDRAGGIALYVVGLALTIIGYIAAINMSESFSAYGGLMVLLIILGVIFAAMFLFMNNAVYAKLASLMPLILMICLVLLYIMSILLSVTDMMKLADNASQNDIDAAFENLMNAFINPGFFLMMTGLAICRAGGNSLLMSMKVMDMFIPGMIILEMPQGQPAPTLVAAVPQAPPVSSCGHCGKPLSYVKEYDRYYCYDCQEYAPKDS